MNTQKTAPDSVRNDDLYSINLQHRDRIMAEAYLSRSLYLGGLLRKAAKSVAKLLTTLTDKPSHGHSAHWFAP